MFAGARSILVVKLSSIGDVVQSLPVAAALRRRYPEAHIAWAVKPPAAEVVAGNPHLTETLVVGGSGASAAGVQSVPPLGAPIRLARALRERRFELAPAARHRLAGRLADALRPRFPGLQAGQLSNAETFLEVLLRALDESA